MQISKKIMDIKNYQDYLYIDTGEAKYRIILLNDDIVRIRCTFAENFTPESSYALVMTAWKDHMDNLLQDERNRISSIAVTWKDFDNYILLSTKKLNIKIYKDPFSIDILDKNKNIVFSDLKGKSYARDEMGRLYHYSCMKDSDCFYGFGEKTGYLNKKKRRMRMHNVDTIGYDSEITDPLYKHIPFYIKLNTKNDIASGIFYHNSYDSVFDMGCERSGYWDKYSYFCADGGELDVFFIYGPQIKDVIKNYTDLTGKTIFPPKFSLGYLGSTMYYTELDSDADKAILQFLDKCKEEKIPCDGFFLSSGYTTGQDGKRYVFNWNYDRFTNPEAFVEEMRQKGAALVPNIKPGMLTTHPLYKEFDANGAYIKDEDNKKSQTDRYWGGQASFVDFTNPTGRELWNKYLKKEIVSLGITSIWNDNNEYEINNLKSICCVEGLKQEVKALRPIMPNIMSFMAKKAILENYPEVRPYIVSRAGFAGIQRYAQTWAGDNNTSWKSLKFNIPVILGMGLSGVANQGCDIGGFFGPAPDPELFVRWVQNGIFQPRFSIHSCNTDNTVTEPWMFPSYTNYIRDAIQLRYQLIPYLYSLLFESATEGSPIMRALIYEFQNDHNLIDESFDFMVGSSLLVANVLEQGAKIRRVYLPAGSTWFDWYTKKCYEGGQTLEVEVSMESIPMYIRNGSIIPLNKNYMNIHKDIIETLHLLIEPSQDSQFVLYDDDGVTNNYKDGYYLKTLIQVKKNAGVEIRFTHEGKYISSIKKINIELICHDIAPIQIRLQEKKIPMFLNKKEWEVSNIGWYYEMEQKVAKIKYDNVSGEYDIYIDFDVKDLISV
ncbi:MAG: Alpha-glucosidase [Firmicutes bacterium]|nr:Alpha-glucosidase [Bacillota bacterium]